MDTVDHTTFLMLAVGLFMGSVGSVAARRLTDFLHKNKNESSTTNDDETTAGCDTDMTMTDPVIGVLMSMQDDMHTKIKIKHSTRSTENVRKKLFKDGPPSSGDLAADASVRHSSRSFPFPEIAESKVEPRPSSDSRQSLRQKHAGAAAAMSTPLTAPMTPFSGTHTSASAAPGDDGNNVKMESELSPIATQSPTIALHNASAAPYPSSPGARKRNHSRSASAYAGPVPPGFSAHKDAATGKTYFYEHATGAVSWTLPDELPAGWIAQVDEITGELFYVNSLGERQWERPLKECLPCPPSTASSSEPPAGTTSMLRHHASAVNAVPSPAEGWPTGHGVGAAAGERDTTLQEALEALRRNETAHSSSPVVPVGVVIDPPTALSPPQPSAAMPVPRHDHGHGHDHGMMQHRAQAASQTKLTVQTATGGVGDRVSPLQSPAKDMRPQATAPPSAGGAVGGRGSGRGSGNAGKKRPVGSASLQN